MDFFSKIWRDFLIEITGVGLFFDLLTRLVQKKAPPPGTFPKHYLYCIKTPFWFTLWGGEGADNHERNRTNFLSLKNRLCVYETEVNTRIIFNLFFNAYATVTPDRFFLSNHAYDLWHFYDSFYFFDRHWSVFLMNFRPDIFCPDFSFRRVTPAILDQWVMGLTFFFL